MPPSLGFVLFSYFCFLVRSGRRKSVVALIGLWIHPAASQLSASHLRQLRHFEIEQTIKEEHCIGNEAETKDVGKTAFRTHPHKRNQCAHFPWKYDSLTTSSKTRTKKPIDPRRGIVKKKKIYTMRMRWRRQRRRTSKARLSWWRRRKRNERRKGKKKNTKNTSGKEVWSLSLVVIGWLALLVKFQPPFFHGPSCLNLNEYAACVTSIKSLRPPDGSKHRSRLLQTPLFPSQQSVFVWHASELASTLSILHYFAFAP